MDLLEAIKSRHSVRSFTSRKIQGDLEETLRAAIDEYNGKGGLGIVKCHFEIGAGQDNFEWAQNPEGK